MGARMCRAANEREKREAQLQKAEMAELRRANKLYKERIAQERRVAAPGVQCYVKGLVRPEMLRWDATSVIRRVYWQWHEWAVGYALRSVSISRFRGDEVELSNRGSSYPLYELIDKPTGIAVYRDPLASLKQTTRTFSDFPELACKVKRIWFHGFHTAETNRLIADLLRSCNQLVSLSNPWTAIRFLDSEIWQIITTGGGRSLQSLELQCVQPMLQHVVEEGNHITFNPLQYPAIPRLCPLLTMTFFAMARTTTCLEEFHVTCVTHTTIEGVMAVAKASRDTLRILEHISGPQQHYVYPRSGSSSQCEHLCDTLRSFARLQALSVSLPSACANLFTREDARFSGDLQVCARYICEHESSFPMSSMTNALQALLRAARGLLVRRSAESCVPRHINVEVFFASYMFEPGFGLVHGEFAPAQASPNGLWPTNMRPSGNDPYGSNGQDDKDDARPLQCIDEEGFLIGVHQGLHPILI
ncbi:hypothetical protein BU25DRAFT_429533 [Macroventuria anomochaeta]|uniref:Uncharacterized protein n=1 Tax=Macroventuria anomochaeta TaxID=301207 RepID=A0ACB6S6D0_9PLEO|nr:uncharacterized protein BU25DRAFT_429533 [Macroventuria anomochaeta]KAF2629841.1 hypothetical protein BU25DRAFT_429533 [Macroventuria anomochaeta]